MRGHYFTDFVYHPSADEMEDDLLLPRGLCENHFSEPGEPLCGATLACVAAPLGDRCSLLGPNTINVVHDRMFVWIIN